MANTFTPTDENSLRAAITAAGNGDTIVLGGNISLAAALPDLTADITFNGAGFTLTESGGQLITLLATLAAQNLAIAGAGTLSIGNGGTTGTLTGNVTIGAGAALAYNHSVINDPITVNIDGAGRFIKLGSGTLTFAGTHTYTGGTTITGGTISAQGGDALPNAGQVDIGALGTLGLADNETIGDLTGTGAVQLGNNTLTTGTTTASSTFSGTLIGQGLAKQGSGTLILTGDSTITGTTISAGTLQIGAGSTTGSLTGPITNNAALVFNRSDDSSFAGNIGGTGSLAKQGAGNLVLTGDASYAGGTTISAGTLTVGDGSAGAGSITGNITNNAALVFNRGGGFAYLGAISGTGSLAKTGGSGTLSLSGVNTFVGNTTVSSGALALSGTGALTSSAVTVDSGASFNITGLVSGTTTTIKSLAGAGNVALGDSTLALGDAGSTTLSGVITGNTGIPGGLVKQGTGTFTLTGASTYIGTTAINAGTLAIGNGGTTGSLQSAAIVDNAALVFNRSDASSFAGDINGTGTLAKQGAGNLTLSGTNTYGGGTTITAGTLTVGAGGTTGSLTGNVTNNAALAFDRSDAVGLAGNITGTGSLAKSGAGTLTLGGTNTYSGGTTITAGTLSVAGGSALSNAGAVSVAAGATLDLAASEAIGDLSGAGAVTLGTSTLLAGTALDSVYTGVISGGVGGALTKLGAGKLTLGGDNTYTGNTSITGGTLQVGQGGTGGALAGNVVNSATLAFSRSDDVSFTHVISGTGSLVKLGAGALTLTVADTYSGATTVSAGKLLVNGSIASSSLVTVQAGATLGGSGTTGAVHVDSGAFLAAGNSPGVLHTGNLALVAGATLQEELGGTTVGNYDQIAVTGTVALGGATLTGSLFGGFVPPAATSFTIIDNDGTADAVTGTFAGLAEGAGLTIAGTAFTITYQGGDGNDVVISTAPAPPPPAPPPPPPPPIPGIPGQVYRLYEVALDRAAERGGLDYYANLIGQGTPVQQIAGGFLQSGEFMAHYGTLDDRAFITQLYANAFNRTPEADGLAYHLGVLAAHPGLEGREDVLLGVAQSPEAQVLLTGVLLDGSPVVPA